MKHEDHWRLGLNKSCELIEVDKMGSPQCPVFSWPLYSISSSWVGNRTILKWRLHNLLPNSVDQRISSQTTLTQKCRKKSNSFQVLWLALEQMGCFQWPFLRKRNSSFCILSPKRMRWETGRPEIAERNFCLWGLTLAYHFWSTLKTQRYQL